MKTKTREFFVLRFVRKLAIAMIFLAALIPVGAECGGGQQKNPASKLHDAAKPVNPCCAITSIDATSGVVTAKVNSTGKSFQFKVSDAALLNSLKAGQGVFANFKTQRVSVNGLQPCCQITSLGAGAKPLGPVDGAKFGSAANPGTPCCQITSINRAGPVDGIVTAKVNATGQTFQYKVTDAALLNSLKVGQGVFANFKTRQVSVNGAGPCCDILSIGPLDALHGGMNPAGPVDGAKPLGPVDGARPAGPVDGVRLSANATEQFHAFKQRAQLLESKLQSANSAEAQQAGIERQKLLAEIDKWTTENGIATERSTQPRAPYPGGGGGGGSGGGATPGGSPVGGQPSCTPEKITGFFWCVLEGESTGSNGSPVCMYRCYKIFHEGASAPAAPAKAPSAPPAGSAGNSQKGSGSPTLKATAVASTSSVRSPTALQGASSISNAVVAPPQSSLVCSTKRKHLRAPVSQSVMIPSGATIYCLLSPLHSAAPITIQTNIPAVAQAPATVTPTGPTLQGNEPYADFSIPTTPIPETVPLTITATYQGGSASTSVTLARAAIKYFFCDPSWGTRPCNLPVIGGAAGGFGMAAPFALQLTAPADPDGLSVQVTGSDGYSGQAFIWGGSSGNWFSLPAKAVGAETPITYSVLDPLDGNTKTINAVLEPPITYQGSFVDGTSNVTNISGVPLDGKHVQVSFQILGDPPADGTPLKIQYGGATNLITGPATVGFPPGGTISFPVTILPCGVNPPCQVTVTAGNSVPTSSTATLAVYP